MGTEKGFKESIKKRINDFLNLKLGKKQKNIIKQLNRQILYDEDEEEMEDTEEEISDENNDKLEETKISMKQD